MSIESSIFAALKGLVSNRVYRDVAPDNVTALPRITFQQIGGTAVNFLSGDKPSKKNARFQINCWDDRRDDVMALARLVEDTLRGVPTLATTVIGAAVAVHEPGVGPNGVDLYGSMQDFSFWLDD
jgi:hypothetical protein